MKQVVIELKQNVRFSKFNYLEICIVLAGVVATEYITSGSGIDVKTGTIKFYSSVRDNTSHLSFIAGMLKNFPPQLYSFAGLPLKGYHFFYDFLATEFISFYHLNIYDVFFRFLPFFLSVLYGMSFVAIARFLKMDKTTNIFLLYLAFFTTDVLFLLPILFHKSTIVYNDGLNPLILNIIDPSVLLATAFLFAFFILIFKHKQRNILLSSLLLGILPEVKIYAAILAYLSLILVAFIAFFRNKDKFYFMVLGGAALISAIIFLPFNLGSAILIFSPFVLYDHFIQGFALYNNLPWYLQFQIYLAHNNYPRIILFSLLTVSLYYLPTLGIRIISIFKIKSMFSRKFYSLQNLFLLFFVILSVFFSSFLIESIDIFNNVQFLWFSYIILLIPTAYACVQLTSYFRKYRFLAAIILFILIFLLNYPKLHEIYLGNSQPTFIVDNSLTRIAAYIKSKVPQNDSILVLNQIKKNNFAEDIYNMPLISAISEHSVYYETTMVPLKNAIAVQDERKKTVINRTDLLISCKNSANVNTTLKNISILVNIKYILTLPQNKEADYCLNKIPYIKKVQQYDGYSLYMFL